MDSNDYAAKIIWKFDRCRQIYFCLLTFSGRYPFTLLWVALHKVGDRMRKLPLPGQGWNVNSSGWLSPKSALQTLIDDTRKGKMQPGWDDGGKLIEYWPNDSEWILSDYATNHCRRKPFFGFWQEYGTTLAILSLTLLVPAFCVSTQLLRTRGQNGAWLDMLPI